MFEDLINFENVTIVWALVTAFSVLLYVILDGFNLGVGILFPFAKNKVFRDQMMNSIAPIWNGNETWLIMGGIALFCAFPVVYSSLLPAVYVPLILMLFGLILRGVAFEFRFKSKLNRGRTIWNSAFGFGSTLATFSQGIILGAYIHGIKIENNQFSGGPFDCFHGFSFLIGLGLIFAYALLGACWLIRKTDGEIRVWAIKTAQIFLPITTIAFIAISIWSPFSDPIIYKRWFTAPTMYYVSAVPFISTILLIFLYKDLYKNIGVDRRPFQLVILLFIIGFIGLGISFWPYALPKTLTIWDAASPLNTQLFSLVGVLIIMPVILIYTAFTYHVFRGKVSENTSYHE